MDRLKSKADKLLDKLLAHPHISGLSIAIGAPSGSIIYKNDLGNIKPDSSWFIASVTKLFITALILKGQSENKLDLDEKITKYLPESLTKGLHIIKKIDYSAQNTIKHLLSQTSGLADYFEEKLYNNNSLHQILVSGRDVEWGFEETIERLKTVDAKFPPGQKGKALYSDTNFQLLGKILEIIHNQPLDKIVDTQISTPLGLTGTFLYTDPTNNTPVKISYKEKQLDIPRAMASFRADGGIVSNSTELNKFFYAFFNGSFFPQSMIASLQSWNPIFFPFQYGTGVMRFKLPRIFSPFKDTPEFIGHSGLSGSFAFYNTRNHHYFTGTVNQIANPSRPFNLLMQLDRLISP